MSFLEKLSPLHLDILKEVGNIGAGNAATALSTLLNKKIDMEVPDVRILPFDEMLDLAGGPETIIASVFLRICGDAPGSMFFVLPPSQAACFIQQMTDERDISFESPPFSEIAVSALQELGNILTGSYLSALSDFTRLNLQPSVPALSIDMAGATIGSGLIELSQVSDLAIVIDTAISGVGLDTNFVNGHFFLLPDPESFEIIFASLGVATND
ncbi:chemotaxis protein CheC [Peribacillus cavernae]|uniref:Chemotaxis protein CheC n=1 Tax=Peribacillus cavernae TaxID=1674310 RepID=A0A3S0W169_9BACI|nr:chemotaxis protein CheC [Peribacillus cavernae]MDQ0217054.1 chemotaxis protein CheC [Peribacillus cavernae]RUQ30467.1 chemotaxis protein CheC [Peribacillus cavernae]